MTRVNHVGLKRRLLGNFEKLQDNLPCSKFFENDENFQGEENQKGDETERRLVNIVNEMPPD